MGIKRKVKRSKKVVSIERKRVLLTELSIHGLIREENLYLDDLFCLMFEYAANGVMLPLFVGQEGKEQISLTQLARDRNEAKELRKALIDNTELSKEEWPDVEEEVNELFFMLLDLVAKGVILPALHETEDGRELRKFRLAHDLREAKIMREEFFSSTEINKEEWDEFQEEIDALLPPKRRHLFTGKKE